MIYLVINIIITVIKKTNIKVEFNHISLTHQSTRIDKYLKIESTFILFFLVVNY